MHRAISDPAFGAGADGSGSGTPSASRKAVAAIEERLRGWLCPYKCPAWQRQRGGPDVQAEMAAWGWPEVVLRWLATTACVWAGCCVLYRGRE